MNQNEELEISPEGEELIRIICGFLSEALEDAIEESDSNEDTNPLEIAQRHISKRMNYMEDEGWFSETEA